MFTIDTWVIIEMERKYPRDVFGSIWEELESQINLGLACICSEVLTELERGTDDLHNWAKNMTGFVCELTQAEAVKAAEISQSQIEWVRESQNSADPFIIAHAIISEKKIVTQESPKGAGVASRNQKIPNVAALHGISTVNLIEWARLNKWNF
jgi:hypothetical protein